MWKGRTAAFAGCHIATNLIYEAIADRICVKICIKADFIDVSLMTCAGTSIWQSMDMSKKTKTAVVRPWTATDVHKLKGLVKNKVDVAEIARRLQRTPIAVAAKARLLGLFFEP